MKVLKQIGRVLAIILAALMILLSVAGIAGSWWANTVLSDFTNRVFSVLNSGLAVAEVPVQRADQIVGDGRAEVQNAADTVVAVGANVQENNPVLAALSQRVETRLGPAVDQLQTTLQPAVSALNTVDQVLSVLDALPFISEESPGLDRLQQAFDSLTMLSADVQQMRATLSSTLTGRADQLTGEAVTVITGITTRVDTRLAELQTTIQTVQDEIDALQIRLAEQNARLLVIYDLVALVATLLLIWITYSQVVMIRYHWRGLRGDSASPDVLPAPTPAPALAAVPVPPQTDSGQQPVAIPVSDLPLSNGDTVEVTTEDQS